MNSIIKKEFISVTQETKEEKKDSLMEKKVEVITDKNDRKVVKISQILFRYLYDILDIKKETSNPF